MRMMEAACRPAVKWTETESETVTVTESWTESGTETERETGTGIETGAGTERGNGTERGRETEAERGIETVTENGTETEMDRSDVSKFLLLQREVMQLYKKKIHHRGCYMLLPVDRNGVQNPVIMWTSCGGGGGGYHMACRDTLMIFSLSAMLIFSGSDSYPERRGVRKGNTVYVYGSGLTEDSLRSAFCQHGNIIDLSMDNPRKYGAIKQLCVHIVAISNDCYDCIVFLHTCIHTVFSFLCLILCLSCDLYFLFLFLAAHLSHLRRWSLRTRL